MCVCLYVCIISINQLQYCAWQCRAYGKLSSAMSLRLGTWDLILSTSFRWFQMYVVFIPIWNHRNQCGTASLGHPVGMLPVCIVPVVNPIPNCPLWRCSILRAGLICFGPGHGECHTPLPLTLDMVQHVLSQISRAKAMVFQASLPRDVSEPSIGQRTDLLR